MKEIICFSFKNFDFVDSYPRNDLKKRGMLTVDDQVIQGYDYGSDAIFLWDLLHAFFKSIVEIEYKTKLISDDIALKSWVKYIQEVGRLDSFPNIKTQEDLIDALTMIVFMASVQHSAVNYTQGFYYGYTENAPAAIYNWEKLDWNNVSKEMFHVEPRKRYFQRAFLLFLAEPPPTEKTLLNVFQTDYAAFPRYDSALSIVICGLRDFAHKVSMREANGYKILDPKSTLAASIYI